MGIGSSIKKALGGGDQKTTSSPWGPQQQYLKEGFKGAQDLYRQGPSQYYPGQTFAGPNQQLQDYMGGMGNYYQQGLDVGGRQMQQGQQLQGGLNQAQQFYSDAAGGYFNPYASAKYNEVLAGSVADNPVLQAQIEQGQQDINRNMQENILPSIASGSVATGNTGSTRRGVAEGVAMRGAMEQGSDLATNLQANAYNQAINQANQWAGGEQYGQSQQFDAAGMLSNLGQYGTNLQSQGYGQGTQAYQDLMGSGMMGQGFEQGQIDADRQRFDFGQNAPWENLQRYQQAISGNYGGETVQEGQGYLNQLMQMGAQGAGAYFAGG